MIESDSFNLFWQVYPRKVAKIAAMKAWRKLNPDHDLVVKIIKTVKKQKTSIEWTVKDKDGKYFIPYPATFLNGQRWEDELTYGHEGKLAEDIRNIEQTITRKKEALEFQGIGTQAYLTIKKDIEYWKKELEKLKDG